MKVTVIFFSACRGCDIEIYKVYRNKETALKFLREIGLEFRNKIAQEQGCPMDTEINSPQFVYKWYKDEFGNPLQIDKATHRKGLEDWAEGYWYEEYELEEE